MGKLTIDDTGKQQIVTFIFDGDLDQSQVDEWNKQIRQLKEKFGNKVKAATVKGEKPPKPTSRRPRKR